MRHTPGYQLAAKLSRNQHTVVYRAARVDGGSSVIVKTLAREYPAPADIRRLTASRPNGPNLSRNLPDGTSSNLGSSSAFGMGWQYRARRYGFQCAGRAAGVRVAGALPLRSSADEGLEQMMEVSTIAADASSRS